MLRIALAALGAAVLMAGAAQAKNVSIVPSGGNVADVVKVPAGARMVYIAGQTADPVRAGARQLGDTKTQTISVLSKIQKLLVSEGFSMGDVVMMRVLLVGDPAKGGAMDFAGMKAGYAQFFNSQPNKPARVTSQVVALTDPAALVEIEVQAAK